MLVYVCVCVCVRCVIYKRISIMLHFCGFLFVLMNVHRSHHEKLVIVDNHICFIGGLDLCFGRYDSPEHKVGDVPPLMWPGKDYYNPR
jgi:phosphatidylserine/phosphatidylglycerophosphate/cardiolipin synthase-like enzyme